METVFIPWIWAGGLPCRAGVSSLLPTDWSQQQAAADGSRTSALPAVLLDAQSTAVVNYTAILVMPLLAVIETHMMNQA
jgi:hypothetical protein